MLPYPLPLDSRVSYAGASALPTNLHPCLLCVCVCVCKDRLIVPYISVSCCVRSSNLMGEAFLHSLWISHTIG